MSKVNRNITPRSYQGFVDRPGWCPAFSCSGRGPASAIRASRRCRLREAADNALELILESQVHRCSQFYSHWRANSYLKSIAHVDVQSRTWRTPPLLVSQWSSLCRPSPPRLCIDPLVSNRLPNHSAMIICSCNVLTDHDVRSTLSGAEGARTAGEVYDRLGCSVQCGRCARTIRRILNEALAAGDSACRQTNGGAC